MKRDGSDKDDIWEEANVAAEYTDTRLQNPEAIIFFRHKDQIGNSRILDLGCGCGRTSWFLEQISLLYVGIDSSETMVNMARARYPISRLLVADARDLSQFADSSFDTILFSFNGLDYMGHSDRLQTLRGIHRVLCNTGYFIFSSHNRSYQYLRVAPRISLCRNPFTQVKNLYQYLLCCRNYYANRKREISCEEYEIYTDRAHQFRFMAYAISRACQILQAQMSGFEIIETYDTEGNCLPLIADDRHTSWLYYVSRKA